MGLSLAVLLAACDEAVEVTREYPSTLGQAQYLQGLPTLVPVQLDAVPADEVAAIRSKLDMVAAALSRGGPVRFAYGEAPDGRDFALRIAMQPHPDLTALSLCQGRSIGRFEAAQRSKVVIAAVCDNRRRLGEVRAVYDPIGASEPLTDTDIVDAAVRKLFALPEPK